MQDVKKIIQLHTQQIFSILVWSVNKVNRKDVNIPNLDFRDPSAVQLYRPNHQDTLAALCLPSLLLVTPANRKAARGCVQGWTIVNVSFGETKEMQTCFFPLPSFTFDSPRNLATSAPRPGRRSHSAHMGLAFVLLKTNREGKATPNLQGREAWQIKNYMIHHDTMMAQHFKSSTTCPNSRVFCDSWISTVWHLPF